MAELVGTIAHGIQAGLSNIIKHQTERPMQQATKLWDLVKNILNDQNDQEFLGEIVFKENGAHVVCDHGIDKQEHLAQLNFNKWKNNVNPMTNSARTPSENAVRFPYCICTCYLYEQVSCKHVCSPFR